MSTIHNLLNQEYSSDENDSDYIPEEEDSEFIEQLDALDSSFAACSLGPPERSEDDLNITPKSFWQSHRVVLSAACTVLIAILCTYFRQYLVPSAVDVIFCDDRPAIPSGCVPCPFASTCSNGKATCSKGRVLVGTECVKKSNLENLISWIHEKSLRLCLEQRGKHLCGWEESWRIHEDQLFDILGEEQENSELFYEAFHRYKTRVILDLFPRIQFVEPFFQTEHNVKPFSCIIFEFTTDYLAHFILASTALIVVYLIYWYLNKQRIEVKQAKLLHSDIYKLLRETGTPLAVDYIRQHLSYRVSAGVWRKCKDRITRDPSIQKSMRMVDGLQKKCWKVGDAFPDVYS